MKKCLSDSLLGLVIIASLFAVTQKANAFTLHNYQTGLCLGVAAGNPNPGTKLVTWTCDGTPSQDWAQISHYFAWATADHGYISVDQYSTTFNPTPGSPDYPFYLSSGLATVTTNYFNADWIQINSTLVLGPLTSQAQNGSSVVTLGEAPLGSMQWYAFFMMDDSHGHECYYFANVWSFSSPPEVIGVLGGKTDRGSSVVTWQLILDKYGSPDIYGHPDQYWCVY